MNEDVLEALAESAARRFFCSLDPQFSLAAFQFRNLPKGEQAAWIAAIKGTVEILQKWESTG
jgi:hypothetical protein